MLARLREVGRKLGRSPRTADLEAAARSGRCPWVSTYHTHFGSYARALRLAGFAPLRPSGSPANKNARETLLKDLRRLAKKLGRSPSGGDIRLASLRGECAAIEAQSRAFTGARSICPRFTKMDARRFSPHPLTLSP
jgi:hypothetical protein